MTGGTARITLVGWYAPEADDFQVAVVNPYRWSLGITGVGGHP